MSYKALSAYQSCGETNVRFSALYKALALFSVSFLQLNGRTGHIMRTRDAHKAHRFLNLAPGLPLSTSTELYYSLQRTLL